MYLLCLCYKYAKAFDTFWLRSNLFFPPLKLKETAVSKKQKQQQQKEQNQKPNDVNYASIMIFEGYFAKPLR